ncbi:MAG: hypothetical protein JWN70_2813 [Planctomycetaceae bacterium]|nr:hypothetical protein [Planctomycetaceae bacterium]
MASKLELIRSAAPSRLYAVAGFSVLSLIASTVLVRWGCGAFSEAISTPGYAVCILLTSLFCCSLKVAAEWPPYRLAPGDSLVCGTLITLPLLTIAVALLTPHWTYLGAMATTAWLIFVAWFCISTISVEWLRWVCGEVIWPEVERFLCPLGSSEKRQPAVPQFKTVPRESLISLAREPVLNDPPTNEEEAEGQEELISRLQRRHLDSGADLLEGQLVATFEAGARQAVLHVPFSPPFSAAPHIDCEVADGSEVRIKVGAVFTYGVRLELKRTSAELPEQAVAVEIYAELPATDLPATVALS